MNCTRERTVDKVPNQRDQDVVDQNSIITRNHKNLGIYDCKILDTFNSTFILFMWKKKINKIQKDESVLMFRKTLEERVRENKSIKVAFYSGERWLQN